MLRQNGCNHMGDTYSASALHVSSRTNFFLINLPDRAINALPCIFGNGVAQCVANLSARIIHIAKTCGLDPAFHYCQSRVKLSRHELEKLVVCFRVGNYDTQLREFCAKHCVEASSAIQTIGRAQLRSWLQCLECNNDCFSRSGVATFSKLRNGNIELL